MKTQHADFVQSPTRHRGCTAPDRTYVVPTPHSLGAPDLLPVDLDALRAEIIRLKAVLADKKYNEDWLEAKQVDHLINCDRLSLIAKARQLDSQVRLGIAKNMKKMGLEPVNYSLLLPLGNVK